MMAFPLKKCDGMQQSEDIHTSPASPFFSVSTTVSPSRMTFQVAANHLPTELVLRVLQEWLGQQRIAIDGFGRSRYTLSYTNPQNTNPLATISRTSDTPSSLVMDYFRLRIRSWLTDTKDFSDPPTFYMSHLLMSLKMADHRLGHYSLPNQPWNTILQDPNLSLSTTFPIVNDHNAQTALFKHLSSLNGLEKIRLDFSAEQYFALFDVAVPPFHYRDDAVTGDNLYPDEYCHGAGLFLALTHDLELHFGDAYKYTNPWYNVQEAAWRETKDAWDYREARLRPRVCESGAVIDWILEYAWYGGYLQHIRKIKLTGDIQQWVKEKWEDIFERHAEFVEEHPEERKDIFAVHRPDPVEIETIGMVDDDNEDEDVHEDEATSTVNDDDDEAWRPPNHYPPPCKCKIGCWRLRSGKIEEEIKEKSWDDFEQYEVEAMGDWMRNMELGPVVL